MASLDKEVCVIGVEEGKVAGVVMPGIYLLAAGVLWRLQLVYIYLERRNGGLRRR